MEHPLPLSAIQSFAGRAVMELVKHERRER